jgi:hypothetical protein
MTLAIVKPLSESDARAMNDAREIFWHSVNSGLMAVAACKIYSAADLRIYFRPKLHD